MKGECSVAHKQIELATIRYQLNYFEKSFSVKIIAAQLLLIISR